MNCSACGTLIEEGHSFCVECGTPVNAVTAPPGFQINLGEQLRAGQPAVLTGRLQNVNSVLWSGELEIRSRSLGVTSAFEVQLQPLAAGVLDLEFTPPIAGSHTILFTLHSADDATLEAKLVLDIPVEAGPTVINVTDARRNDAKFVVGQESHIEVNVGGQKEFASGIRKEEFISLEWSEPSTAIRSANVILKELAAGVHLEQFPQTDRISFLVSEQTSTRNQLLIAAPSISLGKQLGNDLVLRVLPESTENDELWSRISRFHAEIAFTEKGGCWRNLQCVNGTFLNEQMHGPEAEISLQPEMILIPANALALAFHPLEESPLLLNSAAYERFSRKSLNCEMTPIVGPHVSVLIQRVDNLSDEEGYTLTQNSVYIGSSPMCGIRVHAEGISALHAAVHYLGGRFFVESLQASLPIRVNGATLPLHHLHPLRAGIGLQVGSTEIVVSRPHQLHVHD